MSLTCAELALERPRTVDWPGDFDQGFYPDEAQLLQ